MTTNPYTTSPKDNIIKKGQKKTLKAKGEDFLGWLNEGELIIKGDTGFKTGGGNKGFILQKGDAEKSFGVGNKGFMVLIGMCEELLGASNRGFIAANGMDRKKDSKQLGFGNSGIVIVTGKAYSQGIAAGNSGLVIVIGDLYDDNPAIMQKGTLICLGKINRLSAQSSGTIYCKSVSKKEPADRKSKNPRIVKKLNRLPLDFKKDLLSFNVFFDKFKKKDKFVQKDLDKIKQRIVKVNLACLKFLQGEIEKKLEAVRRYNDYKREEEIKSLLALKKKNRKLFELATMPL